MVADSQNCDRVNEGGKCVDCAADHVPFGGVCRYLKDVDCIQFYDNGICELCPPNMVPMPHLSIVSSPSVNVFCQDILEGQKLPNCKYQTSLTTCFYCNIGFRLNESGACVTDFANCLVSTNGVCSSCPPNFTLVPAARDTSGLSFLLSDAETYQTTLQMTWKCLPTNPLGFTYTAAAADPNCANVNPDNSCSNCKDGFYFDAAGLCVDLNTDVEHCVIYIDANKCAYCDTDFYPTDDGSACLPYIDHCKYYDGLNACKICDKMFYLASPTSCLPANDIPGCEIWDSATTC